MPIIEIYTNYKKLQVHFSPFFTAFTILPQAPAYIIASIKANYFSLIVAKYIIIRHLEVSKTTIYLLLKNLKEYRTTYLILYAEP